MIREEARQRPPMTGTRSILAAPEFHCESPDRVKPLLRRDLTPAIPRNSLQSLPFSSMGDRELRLRPYDPRKAS